VTTEAGRREFTVIAIIAAYNEGDIIGQVVGDLVEQGVGVHLLDHGSTDDTLTRVEPYLARGLLRIERYPEESGGDPEEADRFAWRASGAGGGHAIPRTKSASWRRFRTSKTPSQWGA
jgi:hypothetical protein